MSAPLATVPANQTAVVSPAASPSPAASAVAAASQSAATQAAAQQAAANAKQQNNLRFMRYGLFEPRLCSVPGGGYSQAFSTNGAMRFNLPNINGGFVRRVRLHFVLTVTNAAGTGAAYALGWRAPHTLIQSIEVYFRRTLSKFAPYVIPDVYELLGVQDNYYAAGVLAGASDSVVQGDLQSSLPVAVGANTWTFTIEFDTNTFHQLSVAGLLPTQAGGITPQINVIANPSALGPDPLMNAVYSTAGTGAATTVTGTVTCEVDVADGTHLYGRDKLSPDLSGLPAIQWLQDDKVNLLQAGNTYQQRISQMNQLFMLIAYVVDGQQSTGPSTTGNIQRIYLAQDEGKANFFYNYGVGSDFPVVRYLERFRRALRQDIPEGVIPWVVAPSLGTINPDNRDGAQMLNTRPSGVAQDGWPAVYHGYQVGAMGGVAGIAPRVETFLIASNSDGLGIATNG